MSKTVDERVVSMEFDNRQFEKNVETSMSTLDKLKKALHLDGATKGLNDVDSASKKINFSQLEIGATKAGFHLSDVFEKATRFLENDIARRIVNVGKQISTDFTITPVTTGFNEYELKMGSVQTIMASTGESIETVNRYLNELNKYSDDTIYSFQDMTANIGKFTNAGVKLEDAVLAIKGVSNEAAVSGANAQEASRAMYNFAQALSAGYVKLIDWKSIENANMATVEFKNELIKTALEVGTLVEEEGRYITTTTNMQGKTSEAFDATHGFNEALANQWMTTEVLTKTLGKYADTNTEIGKKALEAATKIKTFSMMMDTLKEAAQSGWAETWELIIGDFNEASELWTRMGDFFGDIISKASDARNTFLAGALESNWEKLAKEVERAGVSTDTLLEKISETAREEGIALDDLIDQHGSLIKVIQAGELDSSIFIKTLEKFAGVETKTSEATEDVTNKLEYFQNVVDEIWKGDWGNGEDRLIALTEAGYDYAKVQDLVNKTVDGHRLTLEELGEEELVNIGYTEEEISQIRELAEAAKDADKPIAQLIADIGKPSGRKLLIETVFNLIESITNSVKAVGRAWNETFGEADSSVLYNIIKAIYDLSEKFKITEEKADKLTRAFKGLFAIIDIVRTITSGALRLALKALGKILGIVDLDVLELAAAVGDTAVSFRKWLFENNLLVDGLSKLVDIGATVITFVKDLIDQFMRLPIVQKSLSKIAETSTKVFGDMKSYFEGSIPVIQGFIDRTSKLEGGFTLKNVSTALKDFRNNVLTYFIDINKILNTVTDTFNDFVNSLKTSTGEANTTLKSFENNIKSILDRIKSRFKNVNIGSILVISLGSGLILFCVQLAKVINLIGKPLKALIDFAEGFNKVMTGVSKTLNAVAMSVKAKALLTIAIAIGVLAASVAALAFIPSTKVWAAIGAIAALAVIITGMMVIISKATKFSNTDAKKAITNFAGMGLAFTGLALCLLSFAAVLKIIGKMDEGQLNNAMFIIAEFMALIIAMVLATYLSTPNKLKSLSSLVSSAAVVLVALAVFCLVAKKLDNNALKNAAIVLLEFASFMALMSLVASIPATNATKTVKLISSVSTAMLMLAAFCFIVNKIPPEGIAKSLAILKTFSRMCIALVLFSGIVKDSDIAKAGSMILQVSGAMLLIALTCKIIDKMSDTALWYGMAIMGAMVLLTGAMVTLTKNYTSSDIHKAGLLILEVATAMLIISAAMSVISLLDPKGVAYGIGAVTAVIFSFGVLLKGLDGLDVPQGTIGILNSLSIAIAVLAIAIAALSMIDPANLLTATGALSFVITAFSTLLLAMKEIVKSKNITGKTIAVLGTLIGVIAVIAGALYLLGSMPNPTAALIGAAGISLVLLALTVTIKPLTSLGTSSKKAIKASISVAGLGASLVLIATSLLILSKINTDGIGSKLAIMGVTILALGGICALVNKYGPKMAKAMPSIYLMIVAGGLLAGLMIVLNNVNLGVDKLISVAVGLAALAGGIIVIAGAAVLMQKIGANVALLTMATGFGIFAAAAIGLTAAVFLIIQALKILATTTPEEIEKITATLESLAKSAILLMPLFAAVVASAIIAVCDVIIQTAPKIVDTIVTLVGQIIVGLTSTIPAIVDGVLMVIASILVSVTNYFPTIIDSILTFITQLLDSIKNHIGDIVTIVIDTIINVIDAIAAKLPDIIQSAIDFMLAFIEGLGQGIEDNAEKIRDTILSFCNHIWNAFCNFFGIHSPSTKFAEAGGYLLEGLINGIIGMVTSVINAIIDLGGKIVSAIGGFITSCFDKGKELINNLKDGIVSVASNVANAAMDIGSKIVDGIGGFATSCLDKGKELITNVKDGIANKAKDIGDKAKEIGSSVLNGVKGKIEDFKNAGIDMMNGLKDGINSVKDKVTSTVKNVADNVVDGFKGLLGIHSPSKVFAELGRYTDEGLIIGLKDYSSKVKDASEEVGESAISGVSKAISNISDSFDDVDNTPTIRPVLDLSEIQNGSNRLFNMLDDMDGYGFNASARLASSALSGMRTGNLSDDLSSTVSKLESTVKDLANRPSMTTNNFNITGDNPREIANEVSRILQQQVERRDAIWV